MRRCARISCSFLKHLKEKNIQKRFVCTSSVPAKPYLQLEWKIAEETILHQHINNQQKRCYIPKNLRECWNCRKEHKNRDVLMQCEHCGVLQDVDTKVNYFELLGFPQKFDLEVHALTKSFRKLQTVVHPDKFSNKTSREQSNSADWSSLINKAYKTLLTPLERGQYLLELNGVLMPQDNSALDKEFLMDMMERNEEVEEAVTNNEINALNDRLKEELKEKEKHLAISFSENDLEKSKKFLIEMKYLISIQKSIKNKLQTLQAC